jgi:hypothetical protein
MAVAILKGEMGIKKDALRNIFPRAGGVKY